MTAARAKSAPSRAAFMPRWHVAFGLSGAGVAAILLLFGLGLPQAAWREVVASAGRLAVSLGLTVESVTVSRRAETPRQALLAAVGARRGEPILAFDVEAARARVEAIGWIKEATVSRRLPDAIHVDVVERTPFALWQDNGIRRLIDASGAVIATEGLARFASLPEVVGDGAPRAASELMAVLATEPSLLRRVQASVRVGARRWNVHFKNGVVVRFPEEGLADAWRRLAELDRDKRLLDRDIAFVDMRNEDRLVIRASSAIRRAPSGGQDT